MTFLHGCPFFSLREYALVTHSFYAMFVRPIALRRPLGFFVAPGVFFNVADWGAEAGYVLGVHTRGGWCLAGGGYPCLHGWWTGKRAALMLNWFT